MIIPGNSKSLWSAVKTAKDVNISNIPKELYLSKQKVKNDDIPDAFASHFVNKINTIVNESNVDKDHVYNGTQKITSQNLNFMTADNIITAVKRMKIKNCEGHDRITQRIIIDGIEYLKAPLAVLFNKIYKTKSIPGQWLISKVVPIHKKAVFLMLKTTGPFLIYAQHPKYLKN